MRPLGDHPVLSYPPVPIPYPDHSSSIKRALQRLTEPVGPGCLATADDWSEVLQVSSACILRKCIHTMQLLSLSNAVVHACWHGCALCFASVAVVFVMCFTKLAQAG